MDVLVHGVLEVLAVVVGALRDETGRSVSDTGDGFSEFAIRDALLKGRYIIGVNDGKVSHDILDGAGDGDAGNTRVDLDVPLNVDHCVV